MLWSILEGCDASVTQMLEVRRWGKHKGGERHGQKEEEWAEKPRGPTSRSRWDLPTAHTLLFKGRGVWGASGEGEVGK